MRGWPLKAAPNPFTDPDRVNGPLYADETRIARRTAALRRARVSGRHAGEVIAGLAAAFAPTTGSLTLVDLGCGRGTTTRLLVSCLPAATVAAVDLSAAMLASVRGRLARVPGHVTLVRADFHQQPFADSSCDVIVVAFCLYHSAHPQTVVAEIARCLRSGGTAIFAVKSRDSYQELDELIAAGGIDPDAVSRPSLYETAHSGNIAELAATSLVTEQVIHETHQFCFPTLADAARYLATSPKYGLPADHDPVDLARALQRELPDQPVITTSVVTYLVATRPRGSR